MPLPGSVLALVAETALLVAGMMALPVLVLYGDGLARSSWRTVGALAGWAVIVAAMLLPRRRVR